MKDPWKQPKNPFLSSFSSKGDGNIYFKKWYQKISWGKLIFWTILMPGVLLVAICLWISYVLNSGPSTSSFPADSTYELLDGQITVPEGACKSEKDGRTIHNCWGTFYVDSDKTTPAEQNPHRGP